MLNEVCNKTVFLWSRLFGERGGKIFRIIWKIGDLEYADYVEQGMTSDHQKFYVKCYRL